MKKRMISSKVEGFNYNCNMFTVEKYKEEADLLEEN